MKLLFAAFFAAFAQDAHASKPRVRMPKSAKCSDSPPSRGRVSRPSRGTDDSDFSAVYTMTNQPENEVLVYSRDTTTGELTFEAAVPTGGYGFQLPGGMPLGADPLVSTDSIQVAGQCLLACNVGSHELTTFLIQSASEIQFADRASTGGLFPVSVSIAKKGVIYVLNAGGPGTVQPFNLDPDTCGLSPIGRAVAMDQGGDVVPNDPPFSIPSPTQVGFTPDGDVIATIPIHGGAQNIGAFFAGNLTFTGSLNIFPVNDDGSLEAPIQTLTETPPLAFANDAQGRLLVNIVDLTFSGILAAYEYGDAVGELNYPVATAIDPPQGGTCWLKHNARNGCSYLANTQFDGSISTFQSTEEGVNLIESRAATGEGAALGMVGPLDIVFSSDGLFVYTITTGILIPDTPNDGTPQIHVFSTDCDCGMTVVQRITDGFTTQQEIEGAGGVVNGVVGLAAYPAPPLL